MQSKLSKLKTAWDAGNKLEALRIASKFPQLGTQKTRIMQGWTAHTNPAFYREIGRDPEQMIQDAYAAIAERYNLA